MARSKKVDNLIVENVMKLAEKGAEVTGSMVAPAAEGGSSSGVSGHFQNKMEDLKKQHERVTIQIYKKDEQSGRFGPFIRFPDRSPSEIDVVGGLDWICQQQGGSGTYNIDIIDPSGKIHHFNNIVVVGGLSHKIPLAERNDAQSSGLLPAILGQQPQQGGPNWAGSTSYGELVNFMGRQSELAVKQQESSQQTLIASLLGNQKQQSESSQNMMQIMASMMGGNQLQQQIAPLTQAVQQLIQMQNQPQNRGNGQGEGWREEMRSLRGQMEKQDLERRHSEQIETLRRSMETMQQSKSNTGNDDLWKFMMTMHQTSQSGSQHIYELMRDMMNQPDESEKLGNMSNVLLSAIGSSMNVLREATEMASSQNSDHPAVKVVKELLKGLGDVAGGIMAAQQDTDGQQYMQEPQQAQVIHPELTEGPAPPPQALGPETQVEQPIAGVTGEPITPEQPSAEQPAQPITGPLTDKEMGSIERDPALSKIVAMVTNGEDVSEISARLYAHLGDPERPHPIVNKWFQYPVETSTQVLDYFGIAPQRIAEVAKNIIDFIQYVQNSGDPNKWSERTGYKPVKKQSKQVIATVSQPMVTGAPEFGVDKVSPQEGMEYNSASPPPDSEAAKKYQQMLDEAQNPLAGTTAAEATVEPEHAVVEEYDSSKIPESAQ